MSSRSCSRCLPRQFCKCHCSCSFSSSLRWRQTVCNAGPDVDVRRVSIIASMCVLFVLLLELFLIDTLQDQITWFCLFFLMVVCTRLMSVIRVNGQDTNSELLRTFICVGFDSELQNRRPLVFSGRAEPLLLSWTRPCSDGRMTIHLNFFCQHSRTLLKVKNKCGITGNLKTFKLKTLKLKQQNYSHLIKTRDYEQQNSTGISERSPYPR